LILLVFLAFGILALSLLLLAGLTLFLLAALTLALLLRVLALLVLPVLTLILLVLISCHGEVASSESSRDGVGCPAYDEMMSQEAVQIRAKIQISSSAESSVSQPVTSKFSKFFEKAKRWTDWRS
jgi:hypothetical protein